jgi:hypothetical protein
VAIGVYVVLLFVALVVGTIYAARRRPMLVTDETFPRGTGLGLIGLIALGAALSVANGWPSAMFGYDTAQPWFTHVAFASLAFIVAPVGALFLAGMWQLTEMLRRRAGIVAWPADRAAAVDATLAGLGLGAVFTLAMLVPAYVRGERIPVVPTTSLDLAFPALGGVFGVPGGVASAAMTALPILVLLAVTRSVRLRWLTLVLVAVAGVAAVAPVADDIGSVAPDWVEVVASLCSLIGLLIAFTKWGARGMYAWLIASATDIALGAMRGVVHARSDVARVSDLLQLVAVVAAGWWLVRRALRTLPQNPADIH